MSFYAGATDGLGECRRCATQLPRAPLSDTAQPARTHFRCATAPSRATDCETSAPPEPSPGSVHQLRQLDRVSGRYHYAARAGGSCQAAASLSSKDDCDNRGSRCGRQPP
eukprot:scaffold1027_cov413-Prasinococcus_capsulatus_cf.AAC.16